MATADELNLIRQTMQEQANVTAELQRQFIGSQNRLAQSEAARARDVSELSASQNAFMTRLSESLPTQARSSETSLVDTRGAAKPSSFQSDREVWPLWSFRMSNFLEGAVIGFTKLLDWSADEIVEIDDAIEFDDMSAFKTLLSDSVSTK